MHSWKDRFAVQAQNMEKKKMKIVVLNGSYRKKGTVASLLGCVAEPLAAEHEVEWVDVCKLNMHYCTTCMVCREKETCIKKSHEISSALRAKARRLGEKLLEG
jgi:hypothetical protein